MLISQTAVYALRAMAFLVNSPGGMPQTARDVAKGTFIPEHYASKVLRRMVRADLLVGQKGHGGGFQLACPPERIRYSDIFQAIDEELTSDNCAFGFEKCNTKKPCVLHDSVSSLREQAREWARTTTLASLKQRHVEQF
ncbi:MAG: Rrf2 family transcriptional regulator [Myxococcaceae bacterium]